MAHFDNLEFPRDVAAGAQSVPERRTDLVELASGFEESNQLWADSRRSFAAGLGIRTADHLAAVLALWEEVRGRANSFRFRDWSDFKSGLPSMAANPTDQTLGLGNGSQRAFQLIKAYGSTNRYVREITQPVPGSVRVAVNGTETGGFGLSNRGVVTLDVAPGAGAVVTAGYQFDVPVRFAEDRLAVDLRFFDPDGEGIGAMPDVELVEVRLG